MVSIKENIINIFYLIKTIYTYQKNVYNLSRVFIRLFARYFIYNEQV